MKRGLDVLGLHWTEWRIRCFGLHATSPGRPLRYIFDCQEFRTCHNVSETTKPAVRWSGSHVETSDLTGERDKVTS